MGTEQEREIVSEILKIMDFVFPPKLLRCSYTGLKDVEETKQVTTKQVVLS